MLYEKWGDEISKLKIIFPSRRARLFFVEALSKIAQRPVWQPCWVSIDDMMSRAAGIKVGERVMLIAELYKIYSRYHNESFDKFYFWGEILLSDFDMIDKYLIDADMLFRNVSDIKELESDISYLTEEQLKIVAFWSSLGEEADLSSEKRRFLEIWRSLAPIYHAYRARLEELGIAYTGMIHRCAVDRIANEEYSFAGSGEYVVVGFNALSRCETKLIEELQKSNGVDVFWDYDDYYVESKEQEAGMFIRNNLRNFPPQNEISHGNFASVKQMEVVGAASNVLQCKYVSKIIEQLESSGEVIDKNTAIVLTNENLLLPLLYALPKSVGRVNVTMGYPLKESLAYSFVERLIELQHHSRVSRSGDVQFYHADVEGLLSHPYIMCGELGDQLIAQINRGRMIYVRREFLVQGDELLSNIFDRSDDWESMSRYLLRVISTIVNQPYEGDERVQRDEFLSFIATHITTLQNSIVACDIEMSMSIYVSLLRRNIQTLRIPFEGEPLEGVQVMGILETRNLDFRNVIILSMNDDNFPGNKMLQPSYVPYNLRSAYSLPTPEHHEGVYAYYFYRLIQRAQKVWMVYSSHADEKSTGEPSRYIYQLDYESPFELKRRSVGVDGNIIEKEGIEVEKKGLVAEQLARFLDSENPIKISPTAFFRYVACPLRFYFYSLAGIKGDEELAEDVDAPMFGLILHTVVQRLYTPLIGKPSSVALLEEAMKNLETIVEEAINEHFLQKEGVASDGYSGNVLLVKDIVCRYVRDGIVAYDLRNPNFEVKGVERRVTHSFDIDAKRRVQFMGVLDREDRMADGSYRIVDYKTGAAHLEYRGLESLFNGSGKERMSNIIQTLVYSMMLYREDVAQRITPVLYYVRSMNVPEYSPYIADCSTRGVRREVFSYADCAEEFEGLMREKLLELFDLEIPFRQCEDVQNTCEYCDYRTICKR